MYKQPLFFLLILTLILNSTSTNFSVTSASPFVGALTTWTIIMQNHDDPSSLSIQFSQWLPTQPKPYYSNYTVHLSSDSISNTQLSCNLRVSGTIIRCTLPTGLGSVATITLANLRNPPSTKPYQIWLYVGIENITKSLTVSELQTFQFIQSGISSVVGATSNATLYFEPTYYFSTSTFLTITYDPTVFTVDHSLLQGVTVSSTSSGSLTITRWADASTSLQTVTKLRITNPQAAISLVQLSGELFYLDGTLTYKMQKFYLSFSLVPQSLSSIQLTNSDLFLGEVQQSLSLISHTCAYTPLNQSTSNPSYTQISFSSQYLTSSTCTNSTTSGTNKICTFITSLNTKSITDITTSFTILSSIPLTITTYTYFSGAFYPLCEGNTLITFSPMQVSVTNGRVIPNLSGCSSTVSMQNTIEITIRADNWNIGDKVTISSIRGSNLVQWTLVNSSNMQYSYTLSSSNSVNSSFIILPLTYDNPTFTTSNNSISLLQIYTTSNLLYLNSIQSITLCDVTQFATFQSLSFATSSPLTFATVSNVFTFTPSLSDYIGGDYLIVKFRNYEGTIFLNSSQVTTVLSATINSINAQITVIDAISFQVTLPSSLLITANILEVQNIVNPAAQNPINGDSQYQITLSSYTANSNVKEQRTVTVLTNSYSSTAISFTQTPAISILTNGVGLTFKLSDTLRTSSFSNLSTNVSIILPFSCSNSSTLDNIWSASNNQIVISTTNCQIPYLNSSTGVITAQESLNGILVSLTSVSIVFECSQNCFSCTNGLCTQCVNTTHSSYNFLYNGLCYDACPIYTYEISSFVCDECHSSCQTCSGSTMNQCLTCRNNFIKKTLNGIDLCVSTCGEGKYLENDKCQNCQIDCLYCLGVSSCYVCNEGAVEITTGFCDFTVCQSPCETCEGENSNCTSCISGQFLYNFQCFTTCPEGTFESVNDSNLAVCVQLNVPTLYFPVCITSMILIIIICICNACIDRELTDTHRRHISTVTYCSSILAYMEIFGTLLILAFTSSSGAIALGTTGLVIWLITNIIFALYYFLHMRHDPAIQQVVGKMSSKSKCIYYTTVIFSIAVTVRTYRVLYCGLFRGVAPYAVSAKTNKIENVMEGKKYQEQQNKQEKQKEKENKNDEQISNSKNSSQEDSTKFQLKKPFMIYITIATLIGSLLFIVCAAVQIVTQSYFAMLIRGLDLLIVAIISFISTCIDMWAGIKRSYILAVDKIAQNQTIQNLNAIEEDEQTQQKILHNAKATQKMNQSKNYSPKKNSPTKNVKPKISEKKKSPQKKTNALRKSISPKPVNSKPRERSLSPEQKAQKEILKKNKFVKNRYSDLHKKKRNDEYENSSDNDSEIPDIKVFDDIDLYNEEPVDKTTAGRGKRMKKGNEKQLHSMNNIRKTNGGIIASGRLRDTWKMDDIFLGFEDADDLEIEDDRKTIKFNQIQIQSELEKVSDGKQLLEKGESDFKKLDCQEEEQREGEIEREGKAKQIEIHNYQEDDQNQRNKGPQNMKEQEKRE